MKKILIFCTLMAGCAALHAQTTVKLQNDRATQIIPKEIYGQFAEHLGSCIYGGIWVGPDSAIPNINGYRLDVFNALKELQVPLLRWPGGCFADNYHWRDGIGPLKARAKMVNTNWGGTVEDNSFGTHEFLNLCEMLGCEPYVSANIGSGTVEEMADWVEYMTSSAESPMTLLRKENGREKPWKVKYFGLGNEAWGCGGQMTPEYYSDLYRRYGEYCHDFTGNRLFKIASGASDYDYNWTDVLMNRIGNRMNAVSLHYYCVDDWNKKGSATDFTDDQYYYTLGKCMGIEPVMKEHMAIMDKYDADKRIQLFVDEWGTWWDQEPGTIPGHLFQQNTMRDAMVAALSLNIFHKYTDRVKMANIAQVVNVLQAMILTNEKQMVLTPTYHVFHMYKVHQDATFIPLEINTNYLVAADGKHAAVPAVDVTASKNAAGVVHITLTNTDLKNGQTVSIDLGSLQAKGVTGQILTAAKVTDNNTFEAPHTVEEKDFKDARIQKNILEVSLPRMSIVALELR